MNKLYIDVCTLCRPFDNQQMMRIKLETDAFYLILQNILNENYRMVVSPVHYRELKAISDTFEREEMLMLISKLGQNTPPSKTIESRAEFLYNKKFGVADAVHVAYAEETSDVFISCDDTLVNKCQKLPADIPALNPVEFCNKEDIQ